MAKEAALLSLPMWHVVVSILKDIISNTNLNLLILTAIDQSPEVP